MHCLLTYVALDVSLALISTHPVDPDQGSARDWIFKRKFQKEEKEII